MERCRAAFKINGLYKIKVWKKKTDVHRSEQRLRWGLGFQQFWPLEGEVLNTVFKGGSRVGCWKFLNIRGGFADEAQSALKVGLFSSSAYWNSRKLLVPGLEVEDSAPFNELAPDGSLRADGWQCFFERLSSRQDFRT